MIDFLEEDNIDLADEFRPVPEDKWLPELEQRVKEYMLISPNLPTNKLQYTRIKIPEFKTPEAHKQFWSNQIKLCKNGDGNICGKMYFYFNFCYIEKVGAGKIEPEFRVIDNEWFKLIEQCQRSKEWGIVSVKRRRVGASWKMAADALYDCIFNKHLHIGMNSKSELDSNLLFKKVRFLFNNLPKELRVRVLGQTQSSMNFAWYNKAADRVEGNQTEIFCRAPVSQAFEGSSLDKWICDEAGKIENLLQMWAYTEPAMTPETRRIGVPIIFGTSGDVGKDGAGLRELWNNYEVYKLRRFFFSGWMGICVDEFGNDRKEDAIRWIIYERRRREKLNTKFYNDYVQQYPLTVEEAFSDSTQSGLGDEIKLKAQRESLVLNPVAANVGYFKEVDGNVQFISDRKGSCIIYDQPERGKRGGYIAGCDPADIDDVHGESSDLSLYIVSTQDGMKRPKIVFEYTDRPRELNRYYEQAMLALRYYNDCHVLIERQKGGRMISYFNDHGYKYLLMTQPQEVQRLVAGRVNSIGIHMNQYALEYGRGVTVEYFDECYDIVPSIGLIDDCLAFGTRNTDKAMSFMITMIALKEINKPYLKNKLSLNHKNPSVSYKKDMSGRIVRVVNK